MDGTSSRDDIGDGSLSERKLLLLLLLLSLCWIYFALSLKRARARARIPLDLRLLFIHVDTLLFFVGLFEVVVGCQFPEEFLYIREHTVVDNDRQKKKWHLYTYTKIDKAAGVDGRERHKRKVPFVSAVVSHGRVWRMRYDCWPFHYHHSLSSLPFSLSFYPIDPSLVLILPCLKTIGWNDIELLRV